MPDDLEAALLGEKLRHMIDMLQTDLEAVRKEIENDRRFVDHRLVQLEKARDDHEERLRSATDGVTTFKTWSGLASGGSAVMSVIALVKAFFGL